MEDIIFEEELEDLDNLVKDGHIRASCPHCGMPLASIFENECAICKREIDLDNIKLQKVKQKDIN